MAVSGEREVNGNVKGTNFMDTCMVNSQKLKKKKKTS